MNLYLKGLVLSCNNIFVLNKPCDNLLVWHQDRCCLVSETYELNFAMQTNTTVDSIRNDTSICLFDLFSWAHMKMQLIILESWCEGVHVDFFDLYWFEICPQISVVLWDHTFMMNIVFNSKLAKDFSLEYNLLCHQTFYVFTKKCYRNYVTPLLTES